jgi:AcrR family transcriptional regulator
MPRTSERGGPQTRARIREVANRLFIERGYDSVTVAEVAREAGVSSVTVFNHFPRKEDLFLDRTSDAVDFLRAAIRDRAPGEDALAGLRDMSVRLFEERHPLSGVDELSAGFFRTVAGSADLVARAREIAAELQAILVEELDRDRDRDRAAGVVDGRAHSFDGDAPLFAALFLAGYTSVLVETARRVMTGTAPSALLDDHRARLDRLFDALRNGVAAGK